MKIIPRETRDSKIRDIIKTLAAEYLSRESNRTSLLTITDVTVSDNGGEATIFFTVLPENMQKGALDFLKRKRSEFRDYVKEKSRIGRIPFFDFEIDKGEKNRQRIDEIINQG
jgi:ribosome-binding factor A